MTVMGGTALGALPDEQDYGPPIGGDCSSLGPGYSDACEGKTFEECMAYVPQAPPGATYTVMTQEQHQQFCIKAYGAPAPAPSSSKVPWFIGGGLLVASGALVFAMRR